MEMRIQLSPYSHPSSPSRSSSAICLPSPFSLVQPLGGGDFHCKPLAASLYKSDPMILYKNN
ncbi:hypothetical protein MUK42_34098 [Musa troglodytarum]|uniref:Uncharacterized protein n=1 Tax=Musa troglodytarum TaxID=320322 RepID=A0A9E7FEQ4_9LILI|nr:hypothetical protein MUK42_34098 [Musa troglodytarum]